MLIKICTKCKSELPATVEYFHKNRNGKFGLRGVCKKCYKCYSSVYYTNNRKKILIYNKQYRMDNSDYMQRWYLDNKEAVSENGRLYHKVSKDRKK